MDFSTCRRQLAALLLFGGLSGCAQLSGPPPNAEPLLLGARFANLPLPSADALFELSPAMKEFLRTEMRAPVRQHGPQLGLFRALSEGGHLRIDYDASRTRTAAETFDARAGNCLSLVLMTAALSRELGMSVSYQLVEVPDIWTRSERFVLLNGHVNLSLGSVPRGLSSREMGRYTVDFQPVEDPRLSRVRPLAEQTVVAMFFNNRAVELMEQSQYDQAFAHLRAALQADPHYLNSWNTLAVLYRRSGDVSRAERALQALLAVEPGNRHAASNLAAIWRDQGREADALALEQRLPPPPFADFDRGLRLASQGQWQQALSAFERQLRLAPDFHGVHYQLARAHAQLGHLHQAREHLELAMEQAPTGSLRQHYQAKVKALRRAG